MKLPNPAKYFLVIAISMFVVQGCKTVSTGEMSNTQLLEASKTEPPYSNKEPEKYQFEIWQTSPTGTEKFFAVRSGNKWRIDSAYGEADQVTTLHLDKDYVMAFADKTYAAYGSSHGFDERERMIDEIIPRHVKQPDEGYFRKANE